MTPGHTDVELNVQLQALFNDGPVGGLPDRVLLDRFLSRDHGGAERAFAALVERHGPMVFGVCRRLLADAHLAEDAFQATFLVLARRARSVRNRDVLAGWLHRVARRIAVRARVQANRRSDRERPEGREAVVEYADRAVASELKAAIDEEVDRLRDAQRLPVVLCCLEGLSHEQAAARLRWPLGTVKSRLARGRRALQERLVRRGFAPSLAVAATVLSAVEAEAAAIVPTALAAATAHLAAGAPPVVIPGAVSALVREELGSVIVAKSKLAGILVLVGGVSAALIGLGLAAAPPQETNPKVTAGAGEPAKAPAPAMMLSASGTVVDGAGRPVDGATVRLREWSVYRVRGLQAKEMRPLDRGEGLRDVLAEARTGADGRFAFQGVAAPAFPQMDRFAEDVGNTDSPWDIVAQAPGRGLAWVHLTPQRQRTPIVLTLGPEGSVEGRLVEPEGRPVAGASVQVFGIDPLETRPIDTGLGTRDRLNLIWSAYPLHASTGADGRFVIRELPRDKVITLVVTEPRHERLVAHAATTDRPQPENVARYAPAGGGLRERHEPVHTGPFTLTAKRADRALRGRVTYQDDGTPVARARVYYGLDDVTADADGRYRIDGLTSGTHELSVFAPDSNALPLQRVVEIPDTPVETEQTFALSRGVNLTGRVIDASTGQGVARVRLTFRRGPNQEQWSAFMFSEQTDADGRFRLLVPPGRGTLVVETVPTEYLQPERRVIGQPDDARFVHAVEGRAGATVEVPAIRLSRGGTFTLRLRDADGRPVAGASLYLRDKGRFSNAPLGRSDNDGCFEVTGLPTGHASTIDILAADGTRGATVELGDPVANRANTPDQEVRLQPVGSLAGRLLDDDGKPLRDGTLHLYRNVKDPEDSHRGFSVTVATLNGVGEDGTYVFDQLIPSATYNVFAEANGHANAGSANAKIESGQRARLGDFRLPRCDQVLTGIVVDSQGKPLQDVSVNYDRQPTKVVFYAPSGAGWFQATDVEGRFRLHGLPRGPVRLMAYRRPGGSHRSIDSPTYIDVRSGQSEVRIELRDTNDRLRGIE